MARRVTFCALASAALAILAPATVSAQGANPVSLPAYSINPGDELEIFVWGEERLQRVLRVLPDGTFSFPLVGKVLAANRLPGDIEADLMRGLAGHYRGAVPQVTVSVRNPSGLQFSVIGKVRSPGTFTPGRYVNALEALSFAGGPNEFAQLSNVVIIRKEPNGLVSYRVRLNDVLDGKPSAGLLSAQAIPQLRGGDTVVVP
jgi:polysaccharide export outer membrane protein